MHSNNKGKKVAPSVPKKKIFGSCVPIRLLKGTCTVVDLITKMLHFMNNFKDVDLAVKGLSSVTDRLR